MVDRWNFVFDIKTHDPLRNIFILISLYSIKSAL